MAIGHDAFEFECEGCMVMGGSSRFKAGTYEMSCFNAVFGRDMSPSIF